MKKLLIFLGFLLPYILVNSANANIDCKPILDKFLKPSRVNFVMPSSGINMPFYSITRRLQNIQFEMCVYEHHKPRRFSKLDKKAHQVMTQTQYSEYKVNKAVFFQKHEKYFNQLSEIINVATCIENNKGCDPKYLGKILRKFAVNTKNVLVEIGKVVPLECRFSVKNQNLCKEVWLDIYATFGLDDYGDDHFLLAREYAKLLKVDGKIGDNWISAFKYELEVDLE